MVQSETLEQHTGPSQLNEVKKNKTYELLFHFLETLENHNGDQ